MINKETLLKKIENGETVWYVEQRQVFAIDLEGARLDDKYLDTDWLTFDYESMNTLFADKEEAEWELEFGNITRTEKLELPSWEEVRAGNWHRHNGINGKVIMRMGTAYILIEDARGRLLFEKKLTKENYINACRLCKKLFLEGEK